MGTNERIHPSLGLPGDVVHYTPCPLFEIDKDAAAGEGEGCGGSQGSATMEVTTITVKVPQADIPNIFAHRQWRAGMILADLIHDRRFGSLVNDQIVLELGAGTGLPSMVACRSARARFTLCTDYDSPSLVKTLRDNVQNNTGEHDKIRVMGHTWGQAIDDVQDALPASLRTDTFGVILLADCIWDGLSHENLVRSLTRLLTHSPSSRVIMVSGLHTGREKIVSFLRRARRAGLQLCPLTDSHEREWPALSSTEEKIRQHEESVFANDDAMSHAAQYVMEMEIANRTSIEEARDEQQAQQAHERVWHSNKSRLTGRRRTFVVSERQEERKEVGGVHERNRWITVYALKWSP